MTVNDQLCARITQALGVDGAGMSIFQTLRAFDTPCQRERERKVERGAE